MSTSYYQLLGIPPSATDAEVRAALDDRRRAWAPLQRDPDRRDEAIRWLEQLHEAEAVLTDPTRRAAHDAALATATVSPAPPPRRTARSQTTLVAAAVIVVVALIVGGVLLAGSGDEDDPLDTAATDGAEADDATGRPEGAEGPTDLDGAAEAPSPDQDTVAGGHGGSTEIEGAAASPPPDVAAPPTLRTATVNRTCGDDGNGDCFLSVRAAPSSDAPELGRLSEGTTIDVSCQVPGTSASSSVFQASSSVWVRTAEGRFVAGIFLDVSGWDPFEITSPC